MARKPYVEKINKLDGESANRLKRHVNQEFRKKRDSGESVFDDKVRDVVMNYALDPKSCKSENEYLDDMHYGCEFNPDMLVEQLETFTGVHPNSALWNQNVREAIKCVEKETRPRKPLKVSHLNSPELLADALPKKDANAGWDFIETGLRYKGEYVDKATELFEESLTEALENDTFCTPIITFHRLQVSGAYDSDGKRTPDKIKKKTRMVSAVSMRVIQHEMSTSRAAQKHLGSLKVYAGCKDPVEIHRIVNDYRMTHKYWYSLDYSRYDQRVPGWLIRIAFDVVWSWFSKDAETQKYKRIWDIIVDDFVNKCFIGPDGKLFIAKDGIPSGSMWTQIIGTIVNLLMIKTYECSLNRKRTRLGLKPVKFDCIICGDDNIIFTQEELDLEDMLGYINRVFGAVGHPTKCDKGTRKDDPVFLSRVWRHNGVWRNPKELFAKMLYPERFRNYKENPQLSPELIVYSYILAYPLGMRELIDVNKFMEDNKYRISDFSDSVLNHVGGYLAFMQQYG